MKNIKEKLKKQSKYEILTPSGFKDFHGVKKLTKSQYHKITLSNNSFIKCSDNHKIDTIDGYIYAKNLTINNVIITKKGNLKILNIEIIQEDIDLYDLIEVDDNRNRFYANDFVVSNCAFIHNKTWNSFYSAVYPTISSSKTAKIIILSTPNGKNHFYTFWSEAIAKANGYNAIRVDWWEVPNRDEQWKIDTIKGFGGGSIGLKKFATEFGNDFQGSSLTLIPPETLAQLSYIPPIDITQYKTLNISNIFLQYIKIYHLPEENHIYTIGVDTSKLSEEHTGDATAIQILDITSFPFKQTATIIIREGISYMEIPFIIIELHSLYNNAHIFIENNEGSGQSTADTLSKLKLQNLYWEKNTYPGFRTTIKTKSLGCSNLSLLLEKERLILYDFDTIHQLTTFVRKKESFSADTDFYDDAVMSLIAAIFFIQDDKFDHIDYLNGTIKTQIIQDNFTLHEIIFTDIDDEYIEDNNWIFN